MNSFAVSIIALTLFQSVKLFGSEVKSELEYTLFDKIIASINKEGRVPYPITDLIKKINAKVYNHQKMAGIVSSDFLHYSKNNGNAKMIYFPALEGRFTWQQNTVLIKDRLYLIYDEDEKRLDIMSLDDGKKEFEFQSVKNYSYKGTNFAVSSGGSCLKCHVNNLPLFDQKLHEQNIKKNSYALVAQYLTQSKVRNDDYNPNRVEKMRNNVIFNGIPLVSQENSIALLKNSIEYSRNMQISHGTWANICSRKIFLDKTPECRQNLIYLGFILSLYKNNIADFLTSQEYISFTKYLQKKFRSKKLIINNLEDKLNNLVIFLSGYFTPKDHETIFKAIHSESKNSKWFETSCKVSSQVKAWSVKTYFECGNILISYIRDKEGSFIGGAIQNKDSSRFLISGLSEIPLQFIEQNNENLMVSPKVFDAYVVEKNLNGSWFDEFILEKTSDPMKGKLRAKSKITSNDMKSYFHNKFLKNEDILKKAFPNRQSIVTTLTN